MTCAYMLMLTYLLIFLTKKALQKTGVMLMKIQNIRIKIETHHRYVSTCSLVVLLTCCLI